MAKKQKRTEIKRTPTRRQLSRWQRQKRIQRIIVISAGIFFALVLLFIGYGYYNEQVKPLNQTILRVNDTTFNMDYYLKMLDIFLEGVEPARAPLMAEMILGSIIRTEIIIQHSGELGATVSDEEIAEELRELDLPDDKVRRDALAVDTLTNRLLSEYFESNVPVETPSAKVQALCVETEDDANEIIRRLDEGVEFSALAEEFSVETITKNNKGDLGWLPKGYIDVTYGSLGNSAIEDIAFNLELNTLSKPIYDPAISKLGGYWIIEVIERDEDKSSHVRGILSSSLELANDVKTSLESGADFATLAKDVSEHGASAEYGGDLGWIQKDQDDTIITEFAFTLEPGILSEPLYDESASTRGAYWLVKVLDKEAEREIEPEIRNSMKNKAFYDWIQQKTEESTVEQLITEEQKAWAIERAQRNSGG